MARLYAPAAIATGDPVSVLVLVVGGFGADGTATASSDELTLVGGYDQWIGLARS